MNQNKRNNDLVFLNNFLAKKFGKKNWAKAKEKAKQKRLNKNQKEG